ncbi:MAG: archaetidylserine decarboxylase [Myxococcota bacterium]
MKACSGWRAAAGRPEWQAIKALPCHAVSRAMGRLAGLRLPRWFVRQQIRLFCARFGVDCREFREPKGGFASLQEFFTRRPRPGIRPIDANQNSVISPCDGVWSGYGRVTPGGSLTVKGRRYSLAELLGHPIHSEWFAQARYALFYLSPGDCHRFYAPLAGRLMQASYVPGTLWPIRVRVRRAEGRFGTNERLVLLFRCGPRPNDILALVAIGAMLVGKIHLCSEFGFDPLARGGSPHQLTYKGSGKAIRKGQELGCFAFGSSILLIAPEHLCKLRGRKQGTPVRIGRAIGTREAPWSAVA